MTLSHIEQLEWGVCLVAWCALTGCCVNWQGDTVRPEFGDAILILSALAACLLYGITYAAWRT